MKEASRRAPVDPVPPNGQGHRGERFWTLPFLLVLAAGLFGYGNLYLLVPTIPVYIARLGGSNAELGIIMGLFSVTALVTRPVSGWLADRFGSRLVLALGMGGMGVVSLSYLAADTVFWAGVVRTLHGVGWGLFNVSGATLSAELTPPRNRGAALSIFGMTGGLALASAPVLGSLLGPDTESFLAAAAIGVAALGITLMLPRRGPQPEGAGRRGGAFFSPGAVLPAAVLMIFMCTYGAVFTFVPVLVEERGLGGPGWFFTPYAVAMFLLRTVTGGISDRRGRAPVIAPGMMLAAAGLAVLAWSNSLIVLAGAAVLYAGAMAAIQPVCLAWATDRAPVSRRGAAIATTIAAQDLGIGVGSFAAGSIADAAGLAFLFDACALLALVGLALVLIVSPRPEGKGMQR